MFGALIIAFRLLNFEKRLLLIAFIVALKSATRTASVITFMGLFTFLLFEPSRVLDYLHYLVGGWLLLNAFYATLVLLPPNPRNQIKRVAPLIPVRKRVLRFSFALYASLFSFIFFSAAAVLIEPKISAIAILGAATLSLGVISLPLPKILKRAGSSSIFSLISIFIFAGITILILKTDFISEKIDTNSNPTALRASISFILVLVLRQIGGSLSSLTRCAMALNSALNISSR